MLSPHGLMSESTSMSLGVRLALTVSEFLRIARFSLQSLFQSIVWAMR